MPGRENEDSHATPKQLFRFAEPQVTTSFNAGETPCLCRERISCHLEEKILGVIGDAHADPAKKGAAGRPSLCSQDHRRNRVNRQSKTAAPPRVALERGNHYQVDRDM